VDSGAVAPGLRGGGPLSGRASIRVLVVDDHDLVREGIAAVLSGAEGIEVVGSADGGQAALALYRSQSPQVVLLDVRMPGMDGLETLVQLRALRSDVKVIMLSSHDGDEAIYRAIKAGALGYVLKKQPSRELVEAIRNAYEGRVSLAPAVTARLVSRVSQGALSERETEVLARVARGDSNKEIAGRLFISPSTVKNHIDNIMQKLGASDRTQAVTIALQRGMLTLE
jgi:two-component system NarL family response regulator